MFKCFYFALLYMSLPYMVLFLVGGGGWDLGGRSFIAFTVQIWRRRGLFWQNGDPISAPFARRRRNRTQVQTLGCPEKCHPRRRRRNQHLPNGIPERGPQGKTEEEAWDWRTGCLILEVPRKNGGGPPRADRARPPQDKWVGRWPKRSPKGG